MSNVVYDSHSASSLGDVSQKGTVTVEKRSFGKQDENVINTHDYHFHVKIQLIEDGLQELWKEQNRDTNKNREIDVSSMTDARFRKLGTIMMFPVAYNILSVIIIFLFVPLLFAYKQETNYSVIVGLTIALLCFASICFDMYVMYRSRRYVIEKVTNRYYKVIKNAWQAFESITFMLYIILASYATYLIFTNKYNFSSDIKLFNTFLNKFDFLNYFIYVISIGIIYFIAYYLLAYKVSVKAHKEQRRAVIEARTSSEINADVAKDILDDTIGDFEK